MRLFTRLFVIVLVLGLATAAGGGETVTDRDLVDAVTARLRDQGGTEPDRAAVADALSDQATKRYRQGRYPEAEQAARAAFTETERALGAEHPNTLARLNNLAELYRLQGRYAKAEPLFRRVLASFERLLGTDHPATLTTLNNFAELYRMQGRYAEAEPLNLRALATRERVLGAEHPDTLTSVNNLASLYLDQGRYDEAEPLYSRALAIRERVMGSEHRQTLTSASNLAFLHQAQGRYGEAEPLFRRALAGLELVLGLEHPQTLTSVNNLAALYQTQGRYGEAEPLFRRTLAARERLLGAEHPDTLTSVNNLASLYLDQGRYGEAEPLYGRVLAASEQVLGIDHPHTLSTVNSLAVLYYSQGRYGEAEPLYQRALAARERMLGAEHQDTLQSVNNLAAFFQGLGRYDEAEPHYRRALALRERVLGAEHPQTLNSVNNLASLKQAQGNYREAEPLFRRALTVRERELGAEHPDTLTSVNNLAGLYQAQDRYDEAEPLFHRALEGCERQLGKAHPDTMQTQLNLAAILVNLNRVDPALDQLRTLDDRLRTFVARQLDSTGSEQVRRQWLLKESRLQDLAFTLALAHSGGPAVPLATDILLRWKRLAADEESAIARLARASPDPRVRDLAKRVRQARSDYSALVNMQNPNPKVTAARLDDVERLETELAGLSRPYRSQLAGRSIDWKALHTVLPPGSVLLELRVFRPFDFKAGKYGEEDHWLALLLTAEGKPDSALTPQSAPRLLDLGPVAASDADRQRMTRLTDEDVCLTRYLVLQERPGEPNRRPDCAEAYDAAHFAAPAAAQSRQTAITAELDAASARFYAALFGPLDRELAGFETLYIAPDGVLDLVPFARLRLPDGRYWIERQALRQVQSGRDLIAREPVPAGRGLLALGAVDYGSPPSAVRSSKRAKPHSLRGDQASAPPAADTGPDQPSPRLRTACSRFSSLDGTKAELDYLDTRFRPAGGKVLILRGRDATKSRLKSYAPPPRILHLATHGCFIPRADPTERPMTLSLLALAGANRAATRPGGAAGGDDGILHALEVLDLDLTGTELVALSACDTGKGEVDRSEGVYGMVRAFQIAGAANVLMTLRVLDDELGTEFIADFYRNWLAARPDTAADPAFALRQTQKEWIASERPEKRDPRHWAPYVLVERR